MRTRSSRALSSGVVVRGAGACAGADAGLGAARLQRRERDDRRRRLSGRNGREHVALQHLAALAAAGDRGKIDLVIGGDLSRGRRRRHCGRGGRSFGGRSWLRRGRGRGFGDGSRRASGGRGRRSGETCPSSAPIATVWPVSAAISLKTPALGALTSSVTLSVSSSTSASSACTGSPAFLNHLPTVASVIDLPSVGTRISIAISIAPRGALLVVRERRK